MTMLERIEEIRDHLLHRHHDAERQDLRQEAGDRDHHHHIDQSAGSEFLDMM